MAHLNSAEGIQNMCATQIMAHESVFENGFLKPGGALDQGLISCFQNASQTAWESCSAMIIGDENKLCSIRWTCVY